jgi:hypothetical protein
MDLSFGPYNILRVPDRSINCHMTLSAMHYLLNMSDLLWHILSMAVILCYKSDLLWHIFSMTMTVIVCYKSDLLWVWIPIGAKCTTLCDKVGQWLATGRWFSLGPPVSSTNKADRHDITEILLKVTLNTIKPNQTASINKCPQTLPVTLYFNGSLESKKLFYLLWNLNILRKLFLN